MNTSFTVARTSAGMMFMIGWRVTPSLAVRMTITAASWEMAHQEPAGPMATERARTRRMETQRE